MEHPRRPLDLAGWFARHDEVIDFDIHQVADLDRVAAAVIDMVDRGRLNPQHLVGEWAQHGHWAAQLTAEDHAQLLRLLR